MNSGIRVNVYQYQKAETYRTRTNGVASCWWMSAQRFSAQSWTNEPSNFSTCQAPNSNLAARQNSAVEMAYSYSKQCSIYKKIKICRPMWLSLILSKHTIQPTITFSLTSLNDMLPLHASSRLWHAYTETSSSFSRLKKICQTPPKCWSTTRWQHGSCAFPIPHVCHCRDTWSCMERNRHCCLHCTISYWCKIDSGQRENTRTLTQGISCTQPYHRWNLPVPIHWWWTSSSPHMTTWFEESNSFTITLRGLASKCTYWTRNYTIQNIVCILPFSEILQPDDSSRSHSRNRRDR